MLDEHQKPVDVSQWPRVDETGNCQKLVVTVTISVFWQCFLHVYEIIMSKLFRVNCSMAMCSIRL